MAKVGCIEVEVKPTVTLESAVACVMMLNLFLKDNEDYRLEVGDDGQMHLADRPCGCIYAKRPVTESIGILCSKDSIVKDDVFLPPCLIGLGGDCPERGPFNPYTSIGRTAE